MRRLPRIIVALAGLAVVPAPLVCAQNPLPSFEVTTPAGQRADASQLGGADRWLLVYVVPGNPASDAIVRLVLGGGPDSQRATRVVIIVGASLRASADFVETALPGASAGVAWYADPSGGAWKALGPTGVPGLFGMFGRTIAWTLGGVLGDVAPVEPVVTSWIGS